MKNLVLTAVAAAALVTAAGAAGAPFHHVPHAKPFRRMTAVEQATWLRRQVAHDRGAARWLSRHLEAAPPPARYIADSPVRVLASNRARWRVELRWFRTSARIASANLARVRAALRAQEAARAAPAAVGHLALWECIHAGEGAWDDPNSGGNGHYGGLQMHPGWGYGTSYYANEDSQLVQEQAAERGYRASGYSRAWLAGQWGQTIGPCWQYA